MHSSESFEGAEPNSSAPFSFTGRLKKPEARNVRGVCVLCLVGEQMSMGNGNFRPTCGPCHSKRFPKTAKYRREYVANRRKNEEYVEREKGQRQTVGYKAFKKTFCESCGFVAEESCQLDVDHVDGDKSNDSPDNLRTLCANCHRLKTYREKNFKRRKIK